MISRIDLLIEPYGDINLFGISNVHGVLLDTKHNPCYDEAAEAMMRKIYEKRIAENGTNPANFMIFVPHSRASQGEMHDNVRSLYEAVCDNYGERHAMYDLTLEGRTLSHLTDRTLSDTKVSIWGEHTSGCVLYEALVFLSHLKGYIPLFSEVSASIEPESSVDVKNGFPRPWEVLNGIEKKRRVEAFRKSMKSRYHELSARLGYPIQICGNTGTGEVGDARDKAYDVAHGNMVG